MREFLTYFKLPGEGQVIDRIMSFFSKAYSAYTNIDYQTTHGLVFAIIMLNTDLHNSSIKQERITVDKFIQNTMQINYSGQLTNELLTAIYNEINTKPFTLSSIEQIKKKFAIQAKYINIE